MFLNFRNYAETVLDTEITETQTEITLFNPDVMPPVPFLLYLSSGISLADLQTAERVLVYKRVGDVFTIARDWDNMAPATGIEEPITGSAGDTAFSFTFPDWTYFRIDNNPFLYRYIDGAIEPPLQEDVVGGTARLVGEHWPLDRVSAWPANTYALMLLGDVSIEELQKSELEVTIPDHLTAETLTLSSHAILGPSDTTEEGAIRFQGGDFEGYISGAWVSLTAGESGGGWDPPDGTPGGIVYYTNTTTLAPTDRLLFGDRISLDGKFSVDETDIQYGYLSITEDTIISGNVPGEGLFVGNYGETYDGWVEVNGEVQIGEIIHEGVNSLYVVEIDGNNVKFSVPLANPIVDGDAYVTANNLRRPLTVAASDIILTGDTITLNLYDEFHLYGSLINFNDKLQVNGDIEAIAPIHFQDFSQWTSRSDYPSTPENGMVIFHDSEGLIGYSAGEWHPLLVTSIANPFPVPADQYATVSYDEGWNPSSELLLDPDGAKFAHSIIVGEKRAEAPLVAGMIEYVNNDIQGILRHGESFVRVSLTNLIPSQVLPEPIEGQVPFAEGGLWISSEDFTFSGGTLRSPLIKVGNEVDMAGTIRYTSSGMQWHDGSIWRDFEGSGASVGDPTFPGTFLVSTGAEWVEAAGLIYAENELQVDSVLSRGLAVRNMSDEIVISLLPTGDMYADSFTAGGVQINNLGISGVTNMQVTDMIVTNELTVHRLNVSEMPEEWAFDNLILGSHSLVVDGDDLLLKYGIATQITYGSGGIAFHVPIQMPDLTIDGEVTFNYTIVIGDEKEPGLQDIPGMIRFNGDFQGHLGDGRWASFTLSLADGESGLPGNPEAAFGTGLYWNGDQWLKSAMRIGTDGAVLIGNTEESTAGILRWTGANFQGCIAPGTWVNLSGSEGGAELPTGLVEDSTLRWNGSDWIENPQLRSDGILTTMPLIQIEPYENFYDTGEVRTAASIGETTIEIKNLSTVPYGVIRFANHDTYYVVHSADSESMLIGQEDDPDLGLTSAVGEDVDFFIQGVLPRPEVEGGQIRFNQNDYEGFVEGIGWVSFTGHLSHLPTRAGDPNLRTGHGLYFDGHMWRAYHDISFRSDVLQIHKETEIYGDLRSTGTGQFEGVQVGEHALPLNGMIRYKDFKFQGYADGWRHLSSPIIDEGASGGHTLVFEDGWWYNTGLLTLTEERATFLPEHLSIAAWDIFTHEIVEGDDLTPILSFSTGERFDIIDIRGESSEALTPPRVLIRARTDLDSLTIGFDEEHTPSASFEVLGAGSISGNLALGGGLVVTGATALQSLTVGGHLHIANSVTVDDGDLSLLNGSIETYNLNVERDGYFGGTIRVGYRAGSGVVGAIRYSTPENAARGDWEGWDGEQWVSFTAGFHGQAIYGDASLGDIVAFDGDHWVPSQHMSVVESGVFLGKTYLQVDTGAATPEDEGRIRFTGSQVEACINEAWVPLSGGLAEMPEGSANGQILTWFEDTWLASDKLLVTPQKTHLHNVLQLEPYGDLVNPASAAPGQLRYNLNDYEAYVANIGWVSLTGHVPFQKPWEHEHRLLWSDGSNWVACPLFDLTLDSVLVNGTLETTGRITSGRGVEIGYEDEPDPNVLYRDVQNRLHFNEQTFMSGENNTDPSIPRGVVYHENQQFRNSAAVRMMTRSVA